MKKVNIMLTAFAVFASVLMLSIPLGQTLQVQNKHETNEIEELSKNNDCSICQTSEFKECLSSSTPLYCYIFFVVFSPLLIVQVLLLPFFWVGVFLMVIAQLAGLPGFLGLAIAVLFALPGLAFQSIGEFLGCIKPLPF